MGIWGVCRYMILAAKKEKLMTAAITVKLGENQNECCDWKASLLLPLLSAFHLSFLPTYHGHSLIPHTEPSSRCRPQKPYPISSATP